MTRRLAYFVGKSVELGLWIGIGFSLVTLLMYRGA